MIKEITYDSNKYWLCECDCGWIGSSEELEGGGPIADTGDHFDVVCPICGKPDPDEHELSVSYEGVQIIKLDVLPEDQLNLIKETIRIEEDEYWAKKSQAYIDFEEAKRLNAIKSLFNYKNWHTEIYDLNFIRRFFLVVKTIICLYLKRTSGSYLDPNFYAVAVWDVRPAIGEYSGHEWECVWCDYRFFKGWQVCISLDSSY